MSHVASPRITRRQPTYCGSTARGGARPAMHAVLHRRLPGRARALAETVTKIGTESTSEALTPQASTARAERDPTRPGTGRRQRRRSVFSHLALQERRLQREMRNKREVRTDAHLLPWPLS